jgi:AcrR family transcriptional regulator
MDRQIRILDAAAACIARVGLAKTTLDDVAKEAGCARATVYRSFSSKQQLLVALVARETETLRATLLDAAAATDTLADAVAAVVTTAARALLAHGALTFVASYEPELLLPYLAFEREDAVLRTAATLVAPAFAPYLPPEESARLGEWITRMTLSYLCCPSEHVDVCNIDDVRAFVEQFVLPGFVRAVDPQGVSR